MPVTQPPSASRLIEQIKMEIESKFPSIPSSPLFWKSHFPAFVSVATDANEVQQYEYKSVTQESTEISRFIIGLSCAPLRAVIVCDGGSAPKQAKPLLPGCTAAIKKWIAASSRKMAI